MHHHHFHKEGFHVHHQGKELETTAKSNNLTFRTPQIQPSRHSHENVAHGLFKNHHLFETDKDKNLNEKDKGKMEPAKKFNINKSFDTVKSQEVHTSNIKKSSSLEYDAESSNGDYIENLFAKHLDPQKSNVKVDKKEGGKADKSVPEPINPANPLNVLETAVTSQAVDKASFLSPFEKILNFRDITEGSTIKFKSGLIYRAGLVHLATEKDFQMLVKQYGIKTTIDLRSSEEIRQHPNPLYEKYFPTNRALLGRSQCRLHLPLWKVTMNFKILVEAKKYKTLGQIAMAFARGDKQKGIKLLLGEMNEIKLPGMYKCFIKYVQPQIREALDVCSNPDNYPILVHCSLGKDRTGTICALLEEIMGMERSNIFKQYSMSQANLFPMKEEMIKNLAQYYLEPWLADSPIEVMEETFSWIEKTYGSIPQFFDQIGYEKYKQKELKKNFTKF